MQTPIPASAEKTWFNDRVGMEAAGASPEALARGAAAGMGVLNLLGCTPIAGALAEFGRQRWDHAGFPEDGSCDFDDEAVNAWDLAGFIAEEACVGHFVNTGGLHQIYLIERPVRREGAPVPDSPPPFEPTQFNFIEAAQLLCEKNMTTELATTINELLALFARVAESDNSGLTRALMKHVTGWEASDVEFAEKIANGCKEIVRRHGPDGGIAAAQEIRSFTLTLPSNIDWSSKGKKPFLARHAAIW